MRFKIGQEVIVAKKLEDCGFWVNEWMDAGVGCQFKIKTIDNNGASLIKHGHVSSGCFFPFESLMPTEMDEVDKIMFQMGYEIQA